MKIKKEPADWYEALDEDIQELVMKYEHHLTQAEIARNIVESILVRPGYEGLYYPGAKDPGTGNRMFHTEGEWEEWEAARGELAGTAEDAPCYECGQEARKAGKPHKTDPKVTLVDHEGGEPYDLPFITRKIVALGPVVEARRDPTQTYKLECGHTVI